MRRSHDLVFDLGCGYGRIVIGFMKSLKICKIGAYSNGKKHQ